MVTFISGDSSCKMQRRADALIFVSLYLTLRFFYFPGDVHFRRLWLRCDMIVLMPHKSLCRSSRFYMVSCFNCYRQPFFDIHCPSPTKFLLLRHPELLSTCHFSGEGGLLSQTPSNLSITLVPDHDPNWPLCVHVCVCVCVCVCL